MDYMSTNELTLLLGISAATLTKMIRRGEIPPATHFRGTRKYWETTAIREVIDRLREPRPLADRRATLPASCEAR